MTKPQILKNTYRQRAELTLEAAADLERYILQLVHFAHEGATVTPALRADVMAARRAFYQIKNNAVLILEEPKTL